ncbi:nuclear transport factor 2 family protein [Fodinicola feengrottensis]|uniref:DUF4440 domain-containing protein n=1 Tax=Fodinicola feengrottensis TaxID=435914 RepID=A0ABN2IYN7_9ACTN|nr:nuclear transport factor 2 family protein [Fodinicola feengrottensis]
MNEIEKTVLALEEHMLAADAAYDPEFFRVTCADDFLTVSTAGVASKEQVVEMYAQGGPAGRRNEINDPRILIVNEESAVLTYRLVSTAGDTTVTIFSTSVYRREADGWRMVFLQQTPSMPST